MAKYWAKHFKNVIVGSNSAAGVHFARCYALFSGRSFFNFRNQKLLNKLQRRHNLVMAVDVGLLCETEAFGILRHLGLIVFLEPLQVWEQRGPVYQQASLVLDSTLSSQDNLCLQLQNFERRMSQRETHIGAKPFSPQNPRPQSPRTGNHIS